MLFMTYNNNNNNDNNNNNMSSSGSSGAISVECPLCYMTAGTIIFGEANR